MEWYTFTEQPNSEFELSEEVIHRLPKYGGAFGEDPISFLKWFNIYCIAVKPFGVDMEEFKFRIFPFSLTDYANDWFSYLSPHVFSTWETMEQALLDKYSLNVQEEGLEDILQQLAQTAHQNQERDDKFFAELSEQIAQNSELIFGRQRNNEKPGSDMDADVFWNGRDLDAEQTKTSSSFEVEQIDFITGKDHVISANEEEEGTPNPSLYAPVTVSPPSTMVNPILNKQSPSIQHSPNSHSKVPNVIVNENNVSNAPLLFSVHRNSQTQKERSKCKRIFHREHKNWKIRKRGKSLITVPEFSMFSVHVQKNRSSVGWKPGWKFWKNVSHKVTRNARRIVRKFDGMHPWAPNID